jgi:hypothetical protein
MQTRLKEVGTIFILQKLTIAVFPFPGIGNTALFLSSRNAIERLYNHKPNAKYLHVRAHIHGKFKTQNKHNIKQVSKAIPKSSHTLRDKCKSVQTVSSLKMEVLNVN